MMINFKNFYRIKHTLLAIVMYVFISSFSSLKANNSGGNDSLVSSYKPIVSIINQKSSIKDMTEEELYAFIDKTFDYDTIPLDIINEINMAAAVFKKKENSFENLVITLPPIIGTIPERETSYEPASIREIEKLLDLKLETFEKNVAQLYINNSSFIPTTELIPIEKTVERSRVETLDIPSMQLALDNLSSIPNMELKATENIVTVNLLTRLEGNLENEFNPIVAFELVPNETIIIDEKPNSILVSELALSDIVVAETENSNMEERAIAELPKIIETTHLSSELNSPKESSLLASSEPAYPTNKIVRDGIYTPSSLTVNESKFSSPAPVLNLNVPSSDYYVSWEIDKLFPANDMLKMKKDTSITLILMDKDHHKYFHPFNGPVTSGFGWRDSAQHNGIDIDLNRGDKVSAAFDGMVRVARRYGSYGNVVIIRHYNGLETVYAHLSKIKVKPGQLISSGDLVGLGGSTGRSTGSHLHFEVRFKGVPINPKYLISLTEQKVMCDEFTLKKTKWGLAVFPKNTKSYTVEKGDTIFEIAKRFGTTTASIKEMNHFNGGKVRLKAGQLINVAQ